MTVIGDNIKNARLKLGMKQTEIASQLEITPAAVSHWERGMTHPSSENIEKIEAILGSVNPLAIANWLRETRISNDMTIAQLATSSGISIPTITNIENGYTENPRDRTIEQLEKALNKRVPEDSIRATNEASEIEGLGHLTDFSPDLSAKDEWPSVAGIYVLYDISDRPIYVGQSGNIAKRLKDHSDKFWYRDPIVKYASYVQIEDEKTRKQIEKIFIKFLKSNAVINKKEVDRAT